MKAFTIQSIIILFILTGGPAVGAVENDDHAVLHPPTAVVTVNAPSIPDRLRRRMSPYLAVRSAGFAGWASDDEGMLIQTRFGQTRQLHRVDQPGGRRQQITFEDEPVRGFYLENAEDRAMILSMSRGGDENNQLHWLNPANGQILRVTDGRSRNLFHTSNADASQIIIGSNQRNGRDTDLYIADPRQPDSMQLLMAVENEYWIARDWSPNGLTLLLERYVSINENEAALFDLVGKTMTKIPPPPGADDQQPFALGDMTFSPDGKSILLSTDAMGEFHQLASVDLDNFEYTWLTADIPWDVTEIEVDRATGATAFVVNENGASALYLLDHHQRRRVDAPVGVIRSLKFSPIQHRLGFSLSRPDAPTDVYSLNHDDNTLTRWTFSEAGGLNTSRFVQPRRISYPSFDGRLIPAYVFKPAHASPEKPAPVIIAIHGGPEGQYRPYFSGVDQFYVNEMGAAVIHPNVRGSSGYGKNYLKLDNAEKREDSVRDIGALLDWIDQQPDLDASRVAVRGGSYGGYMVLASLIHYGDRIRAGVDVVGIANFQTFLQNTADYRRDLRRAEYGDERDPEMARVFDRINPTANAHKIQSALLVAHGKNDPRVPFGEAEQIAEAVRDAGGEVWTVYADNEGHGFAKKENRDYLAAVTALFLQKHLDLAPDWSDP